MKLTGKRIPVCILNACQEWDFEDEGMSRIR
jgi:hypothetical protein